MRYSFFAFISRLRHISRWSLMRNSVSENVQEHSHMVAVLAHALAVIRRDAFEIPADPGAAAAAALFHDASEIFTGDLPTPIKYFDPEITAAYKNVEATAAKKLLAALPPELRPAYDALLSPSADNISGGAAETQKLVKAADKLAAYIKCLEELKAGNAEFRLAAEQTHAKLMALNMPEADYFIEHFIPSFGLTLDELGFSIDEQEV